MAKGKVTEEEKINCELNSLSFAYKTVKSLSLLSFTWTEKEPVCPDITLYEQTKKNEFNRQYRQSHYAEICKVKQDSISKANGEKDPAQRKKNSLIGALFLGVLGLIILIIGCAMVHLGTGFITMIVFGIIFLVVAIILLINAKGSSNENILYCDIRDVDLSKISSYQIEYNDFYKQNVELEEKTIVDRYKQDETAWQNKEKNFNIDSQKFIAKKNSLLEKANNNIDKCVANLKVVPEYYAKNPDAVNKMLFLMKNKRASTIKELVNIYEDTIWKEELLSSVTKMSDSLVDQSKLLNELKEQSNNSLIATVKCASIINDSVQELKDSIPTNYTGMSVSI
jgi:hypothetical protein